MKTLQCRGTLHSQTHVHITDNNNMLMSRGHCQYRQLGQLSGQWSSICTCLQFSKEGGHWRCSL